MGIVKISEQMHGNLRTASDALSRSINAQAEHWMRIGLLSELHPGLRYGEICQLLMRSKQTGEDCLQILPAVPAASINPAPRRLRKNVRSAAQ